eukprot:411782-Pelagomonas_calceolata.AAC.2
MPNTASMRNVWTSSRSLSDVSLSLVTEIQALHLSSFLKTNTDTTARLRGVQVYGAPSSQTIAESEAVDQLCEMGFERPAVTSAIRRCVGAGDAAVRGEGDAAAHDGV